MDRAKAIVLSQMSQTQKLRKTNMPRLQNLGFKMCAGETALWMSLAGQEEA